MKPLFSLKIDPRCCSLVRVRTVRLERDESCEAHKHLHLFTQNSRGPYSNCPYFSNVFQSMQCHLAIANSGRLKNVASYECGRSGDIFVKLDKYFKISCLVQCFAVFLSGIMSFCLQTIQKPCDSLPHPHPLPGLPGLPPALCVVILSCPL